MKERKRKSLLWSFLKHCKSDKEGVMVEMGEVRQLIIDCGYQEEGQLLSVRECAELLGVSVRTMYNRLLKGKYPTAKKVNDRWIITKKTIGL